MNETKVFAFHSVLLFPLFFTIQELDGKPVTTGEGKSSLINISLNGLKLSTPLNIPDSRPPVKISVRFTINETQFIVPGEIVWKNKRLDDYFYGIHFHIEEKQQVKLLEELKSYIKGKNEKRGT
ncbi:PilZ domain-containing protein [Mesobacillus subterraneus]|uniref:PilZ domain-containing protein n=1 Tax=Mesobacillus subterraneus TaxID=285983 RepID=UPI0035324D65